MENHVIFFTERDGHASLGVKGIVVLGPTFGDHDDSSLSTQFNCGSKARHSRA
jgi:hypothetical protein